MKYGKDTYELVARLISLKRTDRRAARSPHQMRAWEEREAVLNELALDFGLFFTAHDTSFEPARFLDAARVPTELRP